MRVAIRVAAVGVTVIILPATVITAQASSAPKGLENLAASANARMFRPAVAPRVVSGRLPGNRPFVLPPVGRAPYPVTRQLPGLPGSRSGTLVDDIPSYSPQTSCDPREKVGITSFKRLVMNAYPGGADWGSSRNCSDDGTSEHLEGRAWDWNMDANSPVQFIRAGQLLEWLTANQGVNARRLGVMYIGYNHRIWGAYRAHEGWRTLNSSNPHTDHVHFSFSWNGASRTTSFWTGRTFAEDYGPCRIWANQPAPIRIRRNTLSCGRPAPLPPVLRGTGLLWLGSSGSRVKEAQAKLGTTQSGYFGPVTQAAVIRFQRPRRLPVTGAVDARTWRALGMR